MNFYASDALITQMFETLDSLTGRAAASPNG
jgi:hypothetical protein